MATVGVSERKSSHTATALPDAETGYIQNIDDIRAAEYPLLADTVYLDHAGTTPYAKSLIEAYSKDLTSNLFGNPHSASASSQLASRRIDDVRLRVLQFFNASPSDFDVVFVANATAAIKLVADAFRDFEHGFRYSYHVDSHTSLVGVRELATSGHHYFTDNDEARDLINDTCDSNKAALHLFAYPGQSNMTGARLSMGWCREIAKSRATTSRQIYSLFDAAALVSTSPLDLSDAFTSPDFITVSFYKIFGFPDLGALLVRKDAAHILRNRKYFGGGTVDMVTMKDYPQHAKKQGSLHESLEDGTLPFHSIVALQVAVDVHNRIFGSIEIVARHTHYLSTRLHHQLTQLRHSNGLRVCIIYRSIHKFNSSPEHGPVVAFNLQDERGNLVSVNEVEKLACIKNIQLRTGGLCNPGGVARHLGLTSADQQHNFDAGHRCGSEHDIINGKATGVIRVSLGAMSNLADVQTFVSFIKEFYVKEAPPPQPQFAPHISTTANQPNFVVESMSVYPIKSCAAFKIPSGSSWEITKRGLAWDREWCLIHQGTGVGLSQKRYPRMALLQPHIDLSRGVLHISHNIDPTSKKVLEISLDDTHPCSSLYVSSSKRFCNRESSICGENLNLQVYMSPHIVDFFSAALNVPCTLARCINDGPSRLAKIRKPTSSTPGESPPFASSIRLSNESPILLISRSSINRLNEDIKRAAGTGKTVAADSFRANIVVAEELSGGQTESPYVEDDWQSLSIDGTDFRVLGPCQRCQMVCVDQVSAQRRQEPFTTLAKTRRKDGKVWFGMHLCLKDQGGGCGVVRVGSRVQALLNPG